MTTPLFLLRALSLGLSLKDLDDITIGMVGDMAVEMSNDDFDWPVMATQEDFDQF